MLNCESGDDGVFVCWGFVVGFAVCGLGVTELICC